MRVYKLLYSETSEKALESHRTASCQQREAWVHFLVLSLPTGRGPILGV